MGTRKRRNDLLDINPKREPLTVEKLRTFEGFENTCDEEAENIVYSIRAFSRIIVEFMLEQEHAGKNPQHEITITEKKRRGRKKGSPNRPKNLCHLLRIKSVTPREL
jgi:hypothetical protein